MDAPLHRQAAKFAVMETLSPAFGSHAPVPPPRRAPAPKEFVGRSAEMAALQDEISRVARADAKVLITGASGVGKEMVAERIHALSPRQPHPFIPINCAGLPETILESELFGYVKGSFTGAERDKPGKFEAANRGTVFLDEVGEMTLRMQGLLLRFLQTGELQKVGSNGHPLHSDVRVISATNRDLRQAVVEGAFREDLFYRLNVIQIAVPPLCKRPDDIPLLVEYFLDRFIPMNDTLVQGVTPKAMSVLAAYAWPGNVRELQNVVERLVVTVRAATIDVEHLPTEVRSQTDAGDARRTPRRERRRSIADRLYADMIEERQSFWTCVAAPFKEREIARADVREVIRLGLQEARGNYTIVLRLFNMEAGDYKRFLNFLRKYDCRLPFKDYR
jgi:transcriptional regulator with PAS, ATPase and Fis domain